MPIRGRKRVTPPVFASLLLISVIYRTNLANKSSQGRLVLPLDGVFPIVRIASSRALDGG
jgi:hypothetical protein